MLREVSWISKAKEVAYFGHILRKRSCLKEIIQHPCTVGGSRACGMMWPAEDKDEVETEVQLVQQQQTDDGRERLSTVQPTMMAETI